MPYLVDQVKKIHIFKINVFTIHWFLVRKVYEIKNNINEF